MSESEQEYQELSFYTLGLQDSSFIHQHIVDAQTAQTADENTKPISLTFSLVGLYLYLEKNYTGKQVQRFHMKMADVKQSRAKNSMAGGKLHNSEMWPVLILPANRGKINVSNVLAASPGPERDRMIHDWCVSVWNAYKENHNTIAELTERHNH